MTSPRVPRAAALGTLLVAVLALGACSSSTTNTSESPTKPTQSQPSTTTPPAAGPTARVVAELRGGNGVNLASAAADPLPKSWIESEYAVAGTATSYRAAGPLPTDGEFTLEADTTADYETRIVVRRPRRAADFNGTVLVEWLNVSSGLDAAPDFTYLRNEIVRGGYAWVGVSAQMVGVEGGPVLVPVKGAVDAGAGKGLRAIDPARYDTLHHPGDAYAYDIYTQIGRAVRTASGSQPLGPLRPRRVLAVGESQSAFALTTYYDGIQPLTRAFDGFLIHSRGGSAAPLGRPGEAIDLVSAVSGAPTRLRTDLAAPVLMVETETDMVDFINYFPAEQPDNPRLRIWQVAGTAHADAYIVGPIADQLGCATPVNAGPGHFVVKAALRALDGWVARGIAPPKAPRLTVVEDALQRDEYGNATDGIRTPLVDVPVDTLSGAAPPGPVVCLLFGSTTPLTEDQLAARYSSRRRYLREYRAAAEAAIDAGFVLPEDRAELLAAASPARIRE